MCLTFICRCFCDIFRGVDNSVLGISCSCVGKRMFATSRKMKRYVELKFKRLYSESYIILFRMAYSVFQGCIVNRIYPFSDIKTHSNNIDCVVD